MRRYILTIAGKKEEMVEQYKVNDHILEVEVVPIDVLINIPVVDKKGKVLGRAILTKQIEASAKDGMVREVVVLTDIIVYDPADRGKGVGDELMGFITGSGLFEVVVTGMSTEPGRALCLKHGFKYEAINAEKFLVFRKEKVGEDESKR